MNGHLKNKSIIGLVLMANYVGNAMLTTFKSNISKEFDLSDYENAISSYKKNMTAGKILFRPNKE